MGACEESVTVLAGIGQSRGNRHPSMGRPSSNDREPSPLVVKLQIAGVVVVPMLLLGLWLRTQGFW